MRRELPSLKYGTILLGSALMFGCSHCGQEGATRMAGGAVSLPARNAASARGDNCTTCSQFSSNRGNCPTCGQTLASRSTDMSCGKTPAQASVATAPCPTPDVTTTSATTAQPAVESPAALKYPLPPVVPDTKIPKVTIISIEGSAPIEEPSVTPISYITTSQPAPVVPK